MLFPSLPGSNICAAVNILILTLTLELVSCKLPLVKCPVRHPHDALPFSLASSIAAGIASALGNQIQAHPLPPVVAVLPKVGISIAVHCPGTVILPLISAVKPSWTRPHMGVSSAGCQGVTIQPSY